MKKVISIQKNSEIIKKEAHESRDLAKEQTKNLHETQKVIDDIKENIKQVDAQTKEIVDKISNI